MYHPHALINKGMGLVQWPSRRAWWADVDVMAKGTSGTSLGPPRHEGSVRIEWFKG